jgi:uncharacterized membrane protein YbaN (DUF454 family)
LGVAGIFLPLLPTTPFLLLAAWLFARSSERWYRWLLEHKRLGPYLQAFLRDHAIPLKIKVVSISMLWATLLLSAWWVATSLWLRLLLMAVGVGVSLHILSFKTRPKPHTDSTDNAD